MMIVMMAAMAAMGLLGLGIIALIVGAVIRIFQRYPADRDPRAMAGPDAAMQTLRDRFARGEIDEEEFWNRRALLEPERRRR